MRSRWVSFGWVQVGLAIHRYPTPLDASTSKLFWTRVEETPKLETQNLFRLDGKVAVVTGAGGLLGEQHAIALSDFGATVVLTDLNTDIIQDRAKSITARTGNPSLALACDATKTSDWEAVLTRIMKEFGHVDVLINNAAFTNQSRSANFAAPFTDFPLEDWN